jgi:hypothetical protein
MQFSKDGFSNTDIGRVNLFDPDRNQMIIDEGCNNDAEVQLLRTEPG